VPLAFVLRQIHQALSLCVFIMSSVTGEIVSSYIILQFQIESAKNMVNSLIIKLNCEVLHKLAETI